MGPDADTQKGQPSLWRAALFGLCPQCGGAGIFAAPAEFQERCAACGLDVARFGTGNRLAAFLTLIATALLIVIALGIDGLLRPPLWLQAILWIPLTMATVIYGLRLGKMARLMARLEKSRDAGEGRGHD